MLPFLPLIGTALSGAMSLFGQSQTNSTMESMAANRYQTASADMQKAGLNPAMMFSNGGPAPMPQIQNPSQGAAQAIQQGMSTAMQMKQMLATVDNIQQDTKNKAIGALKTAAEIPNVNADTSRIKAQTVNEGLKSPILKNEGVASIGDAMEGQSRAIKARNVMSIDDDIRKFADQGGYLGSAASDAMAPIQSTAKAMVPFMF